MPNNEKPGVAAPGLATRSHALEKNSLEHATDRPMRRTSVIGQAAWFTAATVDQRRVLAHAIAVAQETAQYRRRVVLAHDDLRQLLVRRLGYQPDQWTGYIPPRLNGDGSPNASPVRTALLELVAEAESRAR